MRTSHRSRPARGADSSLPGVVFTAVFVAAFVVIFVAGFNIKPSRPVVTDASYNPRQVIKPEAKPKVWPLPVSPTDIRKDMLAQIVLEGFDWKREGFGMVSLVSFSIRNHSIRNASNIEIACTYYAGDGVAVGVRKRQIYEGVAVDHSVAVPEINMGLIPDKAQSISCVVSDAQLG